MSDEHQIEKWRSFIEGPRMKDELSKALRGHAKAEHVPRLIISAMQANPKLMDCTPKSIALSVLKALTAGLEPDGRLAALVPYKGVCQLQIMYQGYVQLAYRHPKVLDITVINAYEGEGFSWQPPLNRITHTPVPPEKRGAHIASYSVVHTAGGGKTMEVMWRSEILAIRDLSQAYQYAIETKRKDTPWLTNEGEMCRKTVFKKHQKYLPQTPEMGVALSVDDEPDSSGYTSSISVPLDVVESPGDPQSVAKTLDDVVAQATRKKSPPLAGTSGDSPDVPAAPTAEATASDSPPSQEEQSSDPDDNPELRAALIAKVTKRWNVLPATRKNQLRKQFEFEGDPKFESWLLRDIETFRQETLA